MNRHGQAYWRHWSLPLAIAGAAVVLQLAGGLEAHRWERALAGAQPWRWLTAQLVHLGWVHLAMNLLGLALLWLLFGARLGARGGLAACLASGIAVGLGLALGAPAVAWYAGLSGILHGLVAAGCLAELRHRPVFAALVGAGLVVKLAMEWLAPGLGGSEALIGGAVITESHFYGALGGTGYGLWRAFRLESRP
jgi:rhomboid family GlyGly-CTERM serine protease